MNVRFDVVELCSLNQREHDRGAFAAAIGAGEQPCLATERDAAQRRSAALLLMQMRPSPRKRVNASTRLSM